MRKTVVPRSSRRPADVLPQVRARLRVQPGGRLVEEDQLRHVDQADGDVEPAALAAGHRLRLPLPQPVEVELAEQLLAALGRVGRAHPVEPGVVDDLLAGPGLGLRSSRSATRSRSGGGRRPGRRSGRSRPRWRCPRSGSSSVVSMRSVVVLPAPLGPRKPTISPAARRRGRRRRRRAPPACACGRCGRARGPWITPASISPRALTGVEQIRPGRAVSGRCPIPRFRTEDRSTVSVRHGAGTTSRPRARSRSRPRPGARHATARGRSATSAQSTGTSEHRPLHGTGRPPRAGRRRRKTASQTAVHRPSRRAARGSRRVTVRRPAARRRRRAG